MSVKAKEFILSPENHKIVSIVSLWEIALKRSLHKLDFDGTINEILQAIDVSGFELLGISGSHISYIESLPFIHKDPFDRMLIAQAVTTNLVIITRDGEIPKYPSVLTTW